jgi:hypothetical protein
MVDEAKEETLEEVDAEVEEEGIAKVGEPSCGRG